MRSLGDRRKHIRLEVAGGALWGTLDASVRTRIVNISGTGALLASPDPVPVDSTHSVSLALRGRQITVTARVRHSSRLPIASNGDAPFQIGIEFLNPPAALADALD